MPREELDRQFGVWHRMWSQFCVPAETCLCPGHTQQKKPCHITVSLPTSFILSWACMVTWGTCDFPTGWDMLLEPFFTLRIKCFHYITPVKRGTCFTEQQKQFCHLFFTSDLRLINLALIVKEENTCLAFHLRSETLLLVKALQK